MLLEVLGWLNLFLAVWNALYFYTVQQLTRRLNVKPTLFSNVITLLSIFQSLVIFFCVTSAGQYVVQSIAGE